MLLPEVSSVVEYLSFFKIESPVWYAAVVFNLGLSAGRRFSPQYPYPFCPRTTPTPVVGYLFDGWYIVPRHGQYRRAVVRHSTSDNLSVAHNATPSSIGREIGHVPLAPTFRVCTPPSLFRSFIGRLYPFSVVLCRSFFPGCPSRLYPSRLYPYRLYPSPVVSGPGALFRCPVLVSFFECTLLAPLDR